MLVDTHAHLASEAFEDDRDEVIRRAREVDVVGILCVGDSMEASRVSAQIASSHDGIWATAGIHPHQAGNAPPDFESELVELLREARVVAVGEVGLDYHYDFAPVEVQKDVFRRQVRLAREFGLPLVIHNREADRDVLEIVRCEGAGRVRGVFHCFWSTPEVAKEVLDLGFYIGVGGPITFKRSDELRSLIRSIPVDRLIVETDSPYLAPVPQRGKRNEPAFVVHTAKALAETLGCSEDEVASVTTRNAARLFNLDLNTP